jgi:hypothetical protein
MAADEMLDLFTAIADRHPPASPDSSVITAHIETHAETLFQAVRTAV